MCGVLLWFTAPTMLCCCVTQRTESLHRVRRGIVFFPIPFGCFAQACCCTLFCRFSVVLPPHTAREKETGNCLVIASPSVVSLALVCAGSGPAWLTSSVPCYRHSTGPMALVGIAETIFVGSTLCATAAACTCTLCLCLLLILDRPQERSRSHARQQSRQLVCVVVCLLVLLL